MLGLGAKAGFVQEFVQGAHERKSKLLHVYRFSCNF